MAIDTNPINVSALAQLAGNRVDALHLPLSPITAATEAADQSNKVAQLGINQQNANNDTTRANNEMPIAQMKEQGENSRAALTASVESARNAIYQQQANTQEMYRRSEVMKNDIATRQAQDVAEIQKKQGAYASTMLGMNQVQQDNSLTPDQKAQKLEAVKKQTLDTAYSKGLITKDEYTTGLGMSPQDVYNHAQSEFTANHFAIAAKSGQKADAATEQQLMTGGLGTPPPATAPTPQQKITMAGDDKIAVKQVEDLNKIGEAAKQQMNTADLMQQINNTADSGSFAGGNLIGKKFMEAGSQILGIPYDANTKNEEAFNHLSMQARFEYLQQLKGRPNQSEWKQTGEVVPQITNTPEGRQLTIDMINASAKQKIMQAQFAQDWHTAHGNMSGMQNAYDNMMASVGGGTSYDPKTGRLDSSKYDSLDDKQFINDPRATQRGAVHVVGTIHTDANGNKGMYVGKDPLDPNDIKNPAAWKEVK